MTLPPFPHRNGFARLADLEEEALRRARRRCEREERALGGSPRLGWSRQWEYPYVLANLPQNAGGSKLLDAGSGFRAFTLALAAAGFQVTACDLSATAGRRLLRAARRRGLDVDFRRTDLERLSFPAARFDVVTCVSVLEHTAEPRRVLAELHRVLRPGGRLLLTFDVSVDGRRPLSVRDTRRLLRDAEELFAAGHPFVDRELLDEKALAAAPELLRTAWFRARDPGSLPWSRLSRTAVRELLAGRFRRPFFDLAVIGWTLTKVDQEGWPADV